MISFSDSLFKKLWLTVTATILITVLYSFFLSYLFYEKLYVDIVEESLMAEGNRLASDYKGGPLTDEMRQQVEWYNEKSESEVFLVSNPKELSACLPYSIDYETLIGQEEREQLLEGEPVLKSGFEERFGRKILAVAIPLLDNSRLEGIIYLYVPLAKISELTVDFSFLWLIGGVVFIVIAAYLGFKMLHRLTRPLAAMKQAAEKVSDGDYSARVDIQSNDEIGELAKAFNHMSESVQKEDEKKREFLADVSHELRTPISYIKGYSEALEAGIIKNPEERNKYLKLINRESGRMVKIVEDLLDLSRLDAGEYNLVKRPFSLAQLIDDFIIKYEPAMNEKNISLSLDLDPDIIINGDEGRLEQIFQNIIDNSIRYTEKDGMISIRLNKHSFGCKVEIQDTGIGIPAEDIAKLTDRFYRVNKARSRADGGTGLGLAIVDKLVKLHDGKMEIASELGKGTTIKLYFPVIK
ncbi:MULTISPECIES: ATP-binding protein [unclassified Mesobacillus]|uniref:sensor histidine kinase n=1 Tax=unclassified Mesobacillus TaxID=2675270 RepID=UPI0020418795|nr:MULTISPECIES: ATP-binding protein [unclassified Mesobacillus]MCM3122038.1 cell wall metabolism sensor histidine kinase WalK [Mesobacillus sp. MER 33]MCM3232002.1 cell wall metabolism sensor histidine kinase WalK [Mesobacillus sp. MER 48]